MSINDYIAAIEALINSSAIVASFNLNIDRKTPDIAFLAGRIDFRDGSVLDFKEYIDGSGGAVEKYKYAYNYRTSTAFIFRYDNAPDPSAKDIVTFPHHKHLKNGSLAPSGAVGLYNVIFEAEEIIISKGDR